MTDERDELGQVVDLIRCAGCGGPVIGTETQRVHVEPSCSRSEDDATMVPAHFAEIRRAEPDEGPPRPLEVH